MGIGRALRLWQAAGLQVPRKRPRRRVAASRPRPQTPTGPNQVWSYDFVFDRCANGQQLKCLTVTDEFTKQGLAIDVDGRIRSPRVIEVLSRGWSARAARRRIFAVTTARSSCRKRCCPGLSPKASAPR
jgi:putative transposase